MCITLELSEPLVAALEANRAKIVAIYDERFCRMWEFYLVSAEMMFLTGSQLVFHMQLARKRDAGRSCATTSPTCSALTQHSPLKAKNEVGAPFGAPALFYQAVTCLVAVRAWRLARSREKVFKGQ